MRYIYILIIVVFFILVVFASTISPLIVEWIRPLAAGASGSDISASAIGAGLDNVEFLLNITALTTGIVTMLIAVLTFVGWNAFSQFKKTEIALKFELDHLEEFRTRVVLERHQFEVLVEAVVASYVDARITRIGLEKELHGAAGSGAAAIDPGPASPLDAYSDGLKVRRSMFGIDSYGNLVARGELRDRPKSSVRRVSDRKTGGFRTKGVSPPGQWSKEALSDAEKMVKRSFNFLTGNLQKLAAPIPGDEEDELGKKVRPLVQNMSNAIEFLDSSGRLLETRECRLACRRLRDALDELGSPAGG